MMIRARLRRLAAHLGWRRHDARAAGNDEELTLHLALLAERYQREGLSPADAADAARRQFGNLTLQREERRALRTFAPIEQAGRLLRDAFRHLRVSPLFTATAVLSLALGIGVSTAMFTLLDQLVLRLLPVSEPERLVMIWSTGPNLGDTRNARASSFPLCQDYQRLAVGFDGVFCRATVDAALTIDRATEPVTAELVTGWLSVVFAALATGLAALGLYGVMAFSVARRTKELGLRVALGASAASVLWLVMKEALKLLGAGIVAGLPCALFLGSYVASQLFGVTPADPSTVLAAAAVLMLVGIVATLLPAARAGRLDPLSALRQ